MRKRDNETMLTCRVKMSEKEKLLQLAKSKGGAGFTSLIRLLTYAKKVDIHS